MRDTSDQAQGTMGAILGELKKMNENLSTLTSEFRTTNSLLYKQNKWFKPLMKQSKEQLEIMQLQLQVKESALSCAHATLTEWCNGQAQSDTTSDDEKDP